MVRAQNCYGIVMVSGDGDGDGDVGGGVDSPLLSGQSCDGGDDDDNGQ